MEIVAFKESCFIKDGVPVGSVRINFYPESKSGRVSALGVHPKYQGSLVFLR